MRRNILWFISVLFLFGAICAPAAHATIYTTTIAYTDPTTGFTYTLILVQKLPVTLQTIVSPAALSGESLTGAGLNGCGIAQVILDAPGNGGSVETDFSGGGCGIFEVDSETFALADFSTNGTYTDSNGDTLMTTVVATPEPGTAGLLSLGIGLLLVMRRRLARSVAISQST